VGRNDWQEDSLQILYGKEIVTNPSPKEALLNALLYACEFTKDWTPVEIAANNLKEVMEFGMEYCQDFIENDRLVRSLKVSTRSVHMLVKKLRLLITEGINHGNFRVLCFQYYNLILSLEGLGPLRGFQMGNRWGDVLKGDPERQSVMKRK
jgi:hypothetical protein